jgi:hypothetical protein
MEVSSKEKKKYLTHKGEDGWQLYSKNKANLNPDDGPIREADNGTGYVQNFKEISGWIDDVVVQSRWVKRGEGGKKPVDIIDIHFESGGEMVVLQLSFDTGAGESFAKKFKNINVNKKVTFMAGQSKPEPGQKNGKSWTAISYGSVYDKEDSVPAYYTKEYTDKKGLKFTSESRHGGSEFDRKAFSNWLYNEFIQDVHDAFGHYEEKPQEESSDRDSGKSPRRYDDDDRGRNSSRDSGRSSRRDDDDDDRGGRNSERSRSGSRDDDRGRDDDSRGSGRGRDNDRDSDRKRNDDDSRGRDNGRGREESRNAKRDDDDDRGGRNNRTETESSEREYRSRGNERNASRDESRTSRGDDGPDDDDSPEDLPF